MLSDYAWKALHAALITVVVLVFGIALFWALRGFLPASRIVELPLSITAPGSGPFTADFNFYYTSWCPYCTDATPAVRSLNTLVQGATYGNATVSVNFVNCETNSAKCRTAGVDGYPSYSLVTPQKTFHYAGPPKTATYEQFLVSALGPRKLAS